MRKEVEEASMDPAELMKRDDWITGRVDVVALLGQLNDRVAHIEKMLVQGCAISGAAFELASDAHLHAKKSLEVAVSAMRQTAKCCVVLEGKSMPKRTPAAERNAMKTANFVLDKFLGYTVQPDEVAAVHYRQPREVNAIIMRFMDVKEGSPFSEILRLAKTRRPPGFFAKLMEAPCDTETYYLLRIMRRVKEVTTVFTAKSGKPACTRKVAGSNQLEFKVFDSPEEVRSIMGPLAKEQEEKEDEEKAATRFAYAQMDLGIKQDLKGIYLGCEKDKMVMKFAGVKEGRKELRPLERAGLEIDRRKKLRVLGKTKAERKKGFIVEDRQKKDGKGKGGRRKNKGDHATGANATEIGSKKRKAKDLAGNGAGSGSGSGSKKKKQNIDDELKEALEADDDKEVLYEHGSSSEEEEIIS